MGRKNKYKKTDEGGAADAPPAQAAGGPSQSSVQTPKASSDAQQPQKSQGKGALPGELGALSIQGGPQQQQQGRGPQGGQGRGGGQQSQGRGAGPQHQQHQQPTGFGRGAGRGTGPGGPGGPQQSQQQGGGGWPGQGGGQQQMRGPAPQQSQQQGGGRWPGGQQQQGGAPQQRPGGQQQRPQQSGGPQQRQAGPQQRQQPQRQAGGYQQQQQRGPGSASSGTGGIKRGTAGRHSIVEANYLKLDLSKMPDTAYHYDVTLEPDRPKKFLRLVFDKFNAIHFKNIGMAYDGNKSFYTIERLPCNECTQDVEITDPNGRTMKFKVTIKETENMEIDLRSLRTYFTERVYDKPMRALQCIEVVLSSPCHQRSVRAGRSFYIKPETVYDLNDGYEMWLGLYQAAILGDQPFLNVDISHKSFPKSCTCIEYIQKNCRDGLTGLLSPRSFSDVNTFLKGLTITYTPPKSFGSAPRTYKTMGLHRANARDTKFLNNDGVQITVEAYYASKGFKLQYPMINCIDVSSSLKKNYLPMECCQILGGQAVNRKDQPQQVQQLIKHSVTSTNARKQRIMNMLQYFQHNANINVQRFGIQIDPQFIDVPIRLLNAPIIQYFNNDTARLRNGSWRFNNNTKFLETKQPRDGHKWAIMFKKGSRSFGFSNADALSREISNGARKLNVSLQPKPEYREFQDNEIDGILRDLKSQKFDLVFIVLPAYGPTYADFKQSAELRHGILTQCIKEYTVLRRLNDQLVSNLLLKVNAKLNGINHKITDDTHIPLKNVMYLGADVTHPSPDQRHIPSVVGVAASHDSFGASYNMQYRLQTATEETIADMESIVGHHLMVYKKYQNRYPDYIIYYRDGVSDGQFPTIKQVELSGIKAACKRLNIKPKLTCIIVVKRHHTRLFPKVISQYDKFNNVEPGTVVDRVIVHPNEVQFFMVSHQSIQGTAKPTRYNVIEDEANMDIDMLQRLTYNMCHLFPRCNRAVSYPAPAYLAHLCAYRGRVYLEGTRAFGQLRDEYMKRLVKMDFLSNNPMYFV